MAVKEIKNAVDGLPVSDEEIAEAEKALAEIDADAFTYEFKKPFEWEGKKYDTLTFNFGRLSGNDSLSIMDEIHSIVIEPTLSEKFLVRMCAKACEQPLGWDAIAALDLRAYRRIIGAAKTFLATQG